MFRGGCSTHANLDLHNNVWKDEKVNSLGRRGGASIALTMLVLASACAGGSSDKVGGGSGDAGRTELVLAAAATAGPGFDSVIEGFRDSEAGADWTVTGSYGASGDQSRKVAQGMPVDVMSFSVQPDMERVVDAGVVDSTWDDGATRGVPFGSVVALVVREGNPLGIHGWDDLLRTGVDVVTPDPRSSGSAMWNMLAPYAAKSDGGRDEQAGLDYIRALVSEHVTARPSSARAATDLFLQGSGDVLISYENEAIQAERDGADVEHVVPQQNIRIDEPFAVSARSGHSDGARAFMNYLYSTDGQRRFSRSGFRPVDPGVAAEFADEFPQPERLYTTSDLGGWPTLYPELFEGDSGVITAIYADATR